MNTTLRYDTTARDQLARLERYVAESSVGRGFTHFACVTIVALAWLSAVLFHVKQGDRNRAYLVSGGFAAILTVALPWLNRRYQAAFWRSVLTGELLRGVVGPTTLTVSDEGIEECAPMSTVRASWRDVLRMERSAPRTLVVIAPLIAIAIPATAFPSEQARADFEQMVDARRGAELPARTT